MTVTRVVTFILTLAAWLSSNLLWYRTGKRHGASDVIHQLFAGQADFYKYLIYRKTGGNDAEVLRKLVACLRNDHGMYAEWDGLRGFWTIEVDRDEG